MGRFMSKFFYLILFLGSTAMAAPSKKARLILFDVSALLGYGSVKLSTDAAAPTIGSFTLSPALGVNIKKFSLGVAYNYRILTQHSSVEPSVGNRRGTFISPMSFFIRLNFEKIKFGVMLINSGQYDLMNSTSDGKKVSYLKPNGFIFTMNLKTFKKTSPGIFYESVDFSDKTLDGAASPMTEKINYSNYGFGVRYEF